MRAAHRGFAVYRLAEGDAADGEVADAGGASGLRSGDSTVRVRVGPAASNVYTPMEAWVTLPSAARSAGPDTPT